MNKDLWDRFEEAWVNKKKKHDPYMKGLIIGIGVGMLIMSAVFTILK